MKLYLVQHAKAVSKDIDPNRPLTEEGREDSIKSAQFLKEAGINIDVIWHSTKTRAIETAQLFSKELLSKEGMEQREGLLPNDPVEKIFSDILSIKKDIMVVSHLPFLQKLVSLILLNSQNYNPVAFKMGGVVALEQDEEGKWTLNFEIIPELL